MAVLLGAVKERLGKYEKIDMLENYYQMKKMGFSDKEAMSSVLSKYVFLPNIYDTKKELFIKLLQKNKEIIENLLKQDKARFFEQFMKL